MSRLIITTGTEEDFFAHGREIARLADQSLPIPEETISHFEDVAELVRLITERRINLIQEIKKQPRTLTQISDALGRSRGSVKRDVDALEQAGIVFVTFEQISGQRKKKLIHVKAEEIILVVKIN